jgi:hypothetical protein
LEQLKKYSTAQPISNSCSPNRERLFGALFLNIKRQLFILKKGFSVLLFLLSFNTYAQFPGSGRLQNLGGGKTSRPTTTRPTSTAKPFGNTLLVGTQVVPTVNEVALVASSFAGGGITSLTQIANSPAPVAPVAAS